ncbi:hypothetical protein [Flavobacterium mesophilum]|uniref:hypothetical protein n=1 Tax=Flavobacterium mesophilum TaxID=3143495 RepID=UPI0031D52919
MGKTNITTAFNAREERISAKIIEILGTDQYFDSKSELYTIDEGTLKGFFPREASLKTIADITSRSSLFNYEEGSIALNQTIPVLITYTIQGASSLQINGANAGINGENTIPTKLMLPNYRFEISVKTPTPLGPWTFSVSEIQMPYGKPRKMSPAIIQGSGTAISVLIYTV